MRICPSSPTRLSRREWRPGGPARRYCTSTPGESNTMSPAIYRELHERLCAETDAIVQLTTGGSPTLSVAERLNTVLLAPEMCSLNLGMLNFFIRGQQTFFSNHRSDIVRFAEEMRARGVKPELEAYNEAMLEEAEYLISTGLLEPPYVVNCVLHTPTQGGLRGTPRNLMGMLERMPPDSLINVSSMGRTQLPITTMAMAIGLNVRVGMEDNVYYRRGELVEHNARLVERTVRIARELEREIASPAEARAIIGLRGREPGQVPPPVGMAVA